MGPSSFQHFCGQRPEAPRPRRSRRCLLKGCERRFTPARPQARYCSDACRQAAQQWRRWQASRRYRASTHGQERRRAQQQALSAAAAGATGRVQLTATAAREGQRPAACPRRFCRAAVRSAGLLRRVRGAARRFVPAFLQRGRAAGRYGVCWIGKHAIASGGGAGGANVCTPGVARPTLPEACLSVWEPRCGQLKVPPTPKRRKERVGVNCVSRPPFPFFERGKRGGYVDALGRRR